MKIRKWKEDKKPNNNNNIGFFYCTGTEHYVDDGIAMWGGRERERMKLIELCWKECGNLCGVRGMYCLKMLCSLYSKAWCHVNPPNPTHPIHGTLIKSA